MRYFNNHSFLSFQTIKQCIYVFFLISLSLSLYTCRSNIAITYHAHWCNNRREPLSTQRRSRPHRVGRGHWLRRRRRCSLRVRHNHRLWRRGRYGLWTGYGHWLCGWSWDRLRHGRWHRLWLARWQLNVHDIFFAIHYNILSQSRKNSSKEAA